MTKVTLSVSVLALFASFGVAKADDHLANAQLHGLSPTSNSFGHSQGFANAAIRHLGKAVPTPV